MFNTISQSINKLKYCINTNIRLIAGDTFRAGAVPQLEEWASRTDSLFYGKENTDPAGVTIFILSVKFSPSTYIINNSSTITSVK